MSGERRAEPLGGAFMVAGFLIVAAALHRMYGPDSAALWGGAVTFALGAYRRYR